MAPVVSRLLHTLGAAFTLQALGAAVFVPLQTEKYYDLMGSLGFISTSFFSLYYPYLRARFWENQRISFPLLTSHAPRQLLLTGCLVLWAGRLGTFLFQRVLRDGKDSRFDEVKYKPASFTFFWMAQATWISLVGLPVYLANALPASAHKPLGARDYLGLSIYAGSLLWEITADRQKSAWRKAKEEKKHEESFISSGLWSLSRHPNYVGEVGIHTGMWLAATSTFSSPTFPYGVAAGVATAFAGPIFTYFLLTKVSGVPPLEKAGDKKFAGNPKWAEYKRTVPVFFPWVKA